MAKKDKGHLPNLPATTLDVVLYPRSAMYLLDRLEEMTAPKKMEGLPQYVVIDVCNLRNQLAAHLQRVALGE